MVSNNSNTYQYGNTIRFECKFYDFDGRNIDPDTVKVTIYNYKYEIISRENLGLNNRKELGIYFYDYITAEKEQRLYFEWCGEIDGKPSIKRGEFMTKFI